MEKAEQRMRHTTLQKKKRDELKSASGIKYS
jgi:hypothetical protein